MSEEAEALWASQNEVLLDTARKIDLFRIENEGLVKELRNQHVVMEEVLNSSAAEQRSGAMKRRKQKLVRSWTHHKEKLKLSSKGCVKSFGS